MSFTPLPDEQDATKGGSTPFANVGKKQIAISRDDIKKFEIDEKFVKANPALVDLILKTESMKDEERKYWFQLLPVMSKDQSDKLEGILQNERDQLAELDQKYEAEVSKLNDKHLSQWKADEARAKRKKLESAESADQTKEDDAEEDILKQIEES